MFSRQQELFGWTLWCPKRESRQVSTPLKKDFATEMALTSLGNQKALDILKTLLYFNTRYHKKIIFWKEQYVMCNFSSLWFLHF